MTVDANRREVTALADDLVSAGRTIEAIELLEAADRSEPDDELQRRLIRLRNIAFADVCDTSVPVSWPEPEGRSFSLHDGLPVLEPESLAAGPVRSGILERGCVLVPGLVPTDRCEQLITDIDRCFTAYSAWADGEPRERGWFEPFVPEQEPPGPALGVQRNRAGRAGSIWTCDSPRLMRSVLRVFDDVGLLSLVRDYIGERPVMSATKSNLRRVPLDAYFADWHQDGAFLGHGIRTLNVWIALNDCGVDSPGMDVLPTRLDHIVETGTEGAIFDWAVSPAKVEEVAGGVDVVRPRFGAGDVVLFDEAFLHRTACEKGMNRPRYALENWFFAPSDYPDRQIPLVC